MPAAHADRRDRLRRTLVERDIGAALVTDLVNVRYLSGFTGSNAALLVPAGSPPTGTCSPPTGATSTRRPSSARTCTG